MMSKPLIAVTCSFRNTGEGPWSANQNVGQPYVLSLELAGGTPLFVPCLEDRDEVSRLLEMADALLVTGGPDFEPRDYGQQPHAKFGSVSPERDLLDRWVLEFSQANPDLPVLGICRGIQSMNVIAGGTLVQDIPSEVTGALKHSQGAPGWYGTHDIEVTEGSRLREIFGSARVSVNSFHHQAVLDVAPGWKIVARADDDVVEAIERVDGGFGLGCQFHPELMVERKPMILALFQAFVGACG